MSKVRNLSYNIFSLLTILQPGIEIVKKEIMYNFKTMLLFFSQKSCIGTGYRYSKLLNTNKLKNKDFLTKEINYKGLDF